LKVGMVTDSGTIDDKSFNQSSWEGIEKAKKDLGIEDKYLKPDGMTKSDYTAKIKDLIDGGFDFVVAPGFNFSAAIYESQEKYPDAKFVIIDALPQNEAEESKVANNTIAVLFKEEQSGFIAGVAAATQLKDGDVGFIGGAPNPAVQRYNWGFQQGLKYANENYKTNVTIKAENCVYQGTFNSADAGQQLAAAMYDRGVKAVFAAAGGTGTGVINEAKARRKNNQDVWAIGVDTDQFEQGKYDGDKSAILTSAMKKLDTVTYSLIKDMKDGKFEGGKTLTFDATTDSVGLPEKNPNLSDDAQAKVKEVSEKLKDGSIKVSDQKGDLLD
ncbi:MAG: BMP family ABC transporter substrate-binding protein, partial [Clostridiaceae bacterium]|nr:BMP family ABC transporter substrate-binding protein [Clostridiaceae bacterium]